MTFRRDWLPGWDTYAQLYGIKLRGQGDQRRAACGIHGGTRDSLTVNVSGPWECKACGERGADVLAYHRAVHGCSFSEAARELAAWDEGNGAPGAPLACRNNPEPGSGFPAATEAQAAAAAESARKTRDAIECFNASRTIDRECIAGQYLAGRCCPLPDPGGDLRWTPRLRLFGFDAPALLGRMTLAADVHEVLGAHVTFLEPDGRGGWRRSERRYWGPKRGAVVRLDPDEDVTLGLAIGEGVETMLALRHAYRPVWACMDKGNLAAFPVLAGIEVLVIGADHDTHGAGLRAADACADRWAAAGVEVHVIAPDRPGCDWADSPEEIAA